MAGLAAVLSKCSHFVWGSIYCRVVLPSPSIRSRQGTGSAKKWPAPIASGFRKFRVYGFVSLGFGSFIAEAQSTSGKKGTESDEETDSSKDIKFERLEVRQFEAFRV